MRWEEDRCCQQQDKASSGGKALDPELCYRTFQVDTYKLASLEGGSFNVEADVQLGAGEIKTSSPSDRLAVGLLGPRSSRPDVGKYP